MDNLLTQEELDYLDDLDHLNPDQAKTEKSALIKKRLALKNILATSDGQLIIWGILSTCDIFGTSMTGNSQTYFKEGRRSIGLELLSEILAAAPQSWISMQQDKLVEIQRALNESE